MGLHVRWDTTYGAYDEESRRDAHGVSDGESESEVWRNLCESWDCARSEDRQQEDEKRRKHVGPNEARTNELEGESD